MLKVVFLCSRLHTCRDLLQPEAEHSHDNSSEFMSNNCLLLIMVQIIVTFLKHFFFWTFYLFIFFLEGKYTKVLLY